jgi:hypothetical protein
VHAPRLIINHRPRRIHAKPMLLSRGATPRAHVTYPRQQLGIISGAREGTRRLRVLSAAATATGARSSARAVPTRVRHAARSACALRLRGVRGASQGHHMRSQSARPGEQQRRTRADVGPRPPMSQDLPLYGVTSCRRSHDIVRPLANGRAGTAFPCSVDGATDGGDAIISARADLAYMPASPTPPSPPPACCDPSLPARPDMIYALWPTSVSVLPLHPTSWLGELAVVMDVSANCWPTSQAIAARFCMV